MKIAFIIVRSLLGLLFAWASLAYFLNLVEAPPIPPGRLLTFNQGLEASGYILAIVKSVELACAIAFLSGYFVPLAAVVIFPVTVNIVMIHSLLAPETLPLALFVLAANLFIAWYCRANYRGLLNPKVQR